MQKLSLASLSGTIVAITTDYCNRCQTTVPTKTSQGCIKQSLVDFPSKENKMKENEYLGGLIDTCWPTRLGSVVYCPAVRLPADCRPGRRLRAPHGGNSGYPAVSGSGLLYSTEGAEQSAAVTDLAAAECCSVRPGRAGLSVCRGTAGGAGSLQKTTIVVSSMQEHLDNNRARVGCNTHTKELPSYSLWSPVFWLQGFLLG